MNKQFCRCLLALIVFCASISQSFAFEKDPAIVKKVEALLAQMTLEEKVGQVSQIAKDVLEQGRGRFDEHAMKRVIVEYAVGSILSGGGGYPAPNSPQEWAKMTNMFQKYAEQTRLQIPLIYGVDAVHGHAAVKGAVVFPYDINVAASFNPELAEKSAELTSETLAATGIQWNFAPVLDIARNPKWGRTYETFGEDPYLASIMGARMIQGYQKSGKVAACAKHFVGYGAAESGLDRQPADISERTFREVLFPPFKAAVDAGVRTFMINSGEVNGVPVHASKWLLTDILRKEFGFAGFVVSDWEDPKKIFAYHKAAPDLKQAIARTFNAGLDMSMIPMTLEEIELLKEAVNEGLVPMERLDDAVRNILYVKYELGLFENRYVDDAQAETAFTKAEQAETARMLARQSITLLKNASNTLPISNEVKRLLVAGSGAESKSDLCGGWTIDWMGAKEEDLIVGQTILAAIQDKIGATAQIDFLPDSAGRDQLLEAGNAADAIIAVVGEKSYAEMRGDRQDLSLSPEQQAMLDALSATGKPIILVIVSGRPLLIESAAQAAKAALYAYLPGTEGGAAIADVLFGDYNPAGRLPFSIPKHLGQVPLRYNDRINTTYEPLFPFGYGLSYTKFTYANLQAPTTVKQGEPLTVSVDVTNSGNVAGDDVVLAYYTNKYASVTPRRQQLCGFQRISLQPGETNTVTFTITPEQLIVYNETLQPVEELRPIFLKIGQLQAKIDIISNQ
ncbi:glycoside hydrolase family 3 domain protein [Candidatus Moduliflexus flocculans]|uniref:beta-glucosidase n=1 Tax=Candidatus Moduliflexus flocculans TaxID=1499966 RepID=A0A0S6VPV5_9BACT|nr:glycoside hydrolase family 3 domain protein [Candidatus Moduliflexus flocculans]